MDLNHILLFVALLSPIALLVRSHRTARIHRGWRVASIAVLVITFAAWLIVPRQAGLIGGALWFVLLLLPVIISRKIADSILRERFAFARRLSGFLAVLHPTGDARLQKQLLFALEVAQRGELARAIHLLESLARSDDDAINRQAVAQTFRLRGDWEGLVTWCRVKVLPRFRQSNELLPLYFRALGETHRLDDLTLQVAAYREAFSTETPENLPLQLSLLTLWVFNGRKAQLVRLLETSLRRLSPERKAFWIATCELAGGDVTTGRAAIARLQSDASDAQLRAEIAARLERADDYASSARELSAENHRILQRLETRRMKPSPYAASSPGVTPVVLTLIILNVAMFLIEVVLGGSTNPLVLHRLGQLETWDFFSRGEYWRLITSLLLHYGPLHLLFNIYALYILGPALERSIGMLRFFACYLISGIGSGLGVVLLHVVRLTPAEEVVGASGCIMGVVGAWAGFLLHNRHLPLARRRLQNVVIIVVIQTLFDLSTPQVSMAAHICGLITGFVVGLILTPREV